MVEAAGHGQSSARGYRNISQVVTTAEQAVVSNLEVAAIDHGRACVGVVARERNRAVTSLGDAEAARDSAVPEVQKHRARRAAVINRPSIIGTKNDRLVEKEGARTSVGGIGGGDAGVDRQVARTV